MGREEKVNINSTYYKKRHGGSMLPGIKFISEAEFKKSWWQKIKDFFRKVTGF